MCQKALGVSRGLLEYLRFAGLFLARSAGLEPATFSVRSHSPSQTGRYSGGQGETKQRFYRKLALLKGQGETPSCSQIAVNVLGIRASVLSETRAAVKSALPSRETKPLR